MKITVFQSDNGDCLLLTSAQGVNMLVDGGMRESFSEHAASAISALPKLDVVYVSHIDSDHISGVLQLLDDTVDWRRHEYQLGVGNDEHPVPTAPRPPAIDKIWHNGFHTILGQNSGRIEDALAATASILSGANSSVLKGEGELRRGLATSVREAIQLSHRIDGTHLGIPLNPEFENKLMMVKEGQPQIALGDLSVTVLAPFEEDLVKLRKEWNEWLEEHEDVVAELKAIARAEELEYASDEVKRIVQPPLAQAKVLGRRSRVTTPNLASLMLLVEEGGKTVLLTGDGHHREILRGLEHHGKLNGAPLHVDVLKIQHHGSEHNIAREFCEKVTADHYIFCGNGKHENPELDVIDLVVKSREADNKKFKLWFNSRGTLPAPPNNKELVEARAHMKEVEKRVKEHKQRLGSRMQYQFLTASQFEIDLT